tara:strand:+ start:657 stop:998 length:342 start_codon:yes stop_codon:yes gene_type:complete
VIEDKIKQIEEQAKKMIEEGQKLASLKDTLQKLEQCMESGHDWRLGMGNTNNYRTEIIGVQGNISDVFEIPLYCTNCGSRVVMKDKEGADVYYAMGNKVSELLGGDDDEIQEE